MRADTVTKDFMADTEVFADVFNYYIYGGDQVILPENLTQRDSTKIALPFGTDGRVVPVQKFRDAQKLYTSMTARAHRRAMKRAREEALKKEQNVGEKADTLLQKKPDSGEFLSGFWREDKLIPSVTVTVYFGSDEWDGPLNLFDMMDVEDSRIFSFMNNYQVRLIAPAQMPDSEIEKFQTNLREVFLFIKYSKDKEKLYEILKSNEARFREMERRAADVIEAVTNSGLKYDEKEMKVDVCEAIKEMRLESEQIGEKRGQQRGEKIGALRTAQENARNFYKLGVEVGKIAEGVGYDVDIVKGWLGLSS